MDIRRMRVFLAVHCGDFEYAKFAHNDDQVRILQMELDSLSDMGLIEYNPTKAGSCCLYVSTDHGKRVVTKLVETFDDENIGR